MDPLEAILASMAAATGNAPAPSAPAKKASSTTSSSMHTGSSKPKSAATAASKSKKRLRDNAHADVDAVDRDDSDDHLLTFPDVANGEAVIWNPHVMHKLSDAELQRIERTSMQLRVTPAMEIARQQTVRTLCAKIKRAGEEMGIAKLPNSTYETWQFTSKLTVAENDPLIPHAGSDYSGLLEELVKAGAPRAAATRKCKELTRESERLLRKFAQLDVSGGSSNGKRRVQCRAGDGVYALSYGNTRVTLSAAHYAKLRTLYARHAPQHVTLDASKQQQAFERALFSLLLRYESLDGGGFQAALNEECFDALLRHFGCAMECFASPLNCRYARFCSAFADTDAPFGSAGSFFDFAPRAGCFEANPPFIPQVITRMAEHMAALLEAPRAGPLMFIVVIPAWQHTPGWQQLSASRFNQRHVLVPQRAHGYCEGKQHVRKTRWRIASFDTSVFFWQNAAAQRKWPVTDAAVRDLTDAFRSKQADERAALGLRKSGKRVKAAVEST